MSDRVEVVHGRAEDVGRDPRRRQTADVVTARSFGPPAVTAECAAPLLRVGGRLLVSEPPDATDRWPESDLAALGLVPGEPGAVHGFAFVQLVQGKPCPGRDPRRAGVPERSPLF
jgi:16S rRNA (guanine527-N7)-methyltransferase